THSWGPLGSWDGQATWVATGPVKGQDRYAYALNLAYRPPPRAGGGILQVGKSDFRIVRAGGGLACDASKGRVAAFGEVFHVRGLLAVGALGVSAVVSLDEAQLFQVRILERNPLER